MDYFFEESSVQIYQDNAIATVKWLGLARSPEYRVAYEQFWDMLQQAEEPLTLWLLDCRGGKVVDIKDQNWTVIDWCDMLLEHTHLLPKRIAIVLSSDIFNKIATRVIWSRIAQSANAELAYFGEEEEATDWLMKPAEATEDVDVLA